MFSCKVFPVGTRFERDNVASSLVLFMVEQLATQIYLSAKSHDVTHVVFVGSFVAKQPLIRRLFRDKLHNCSVFLQVSAAGFAGNFVDA